MGEIHWREVRTILLDMDGTLLDLHFDNHFWLHHVPKRYAEASGLSEQQAKDELLARYRNAEGTLEWYCVDHWSRELGLDIALLKEEVDHLIAVHPYVEDFLRAMREQGRRVALVTNAHQKALKLKMERTRLAGYFDNVVCAHDLGVPKENLSFWDKLRAVEPFDPGHTLFVDDSESVLRSARAYGIRWLRAVRRPDTQGPEKHWAEFDAIDSFRELIPQEA